MKDLTGLIYTGRLTNTPELVALFLEESGSATWAKWGDVSEIYSTAPAPNTEIEQAYYDMRDAFS